MREMLSGMIVAAYLVGALYFAKFWSRTGDRFFLVFASAFVILSLQRALLVLWVSSPELTPWLYGLRLAAFVLILVAILDKNR
jgi:hypothetical protein